MGVEWWGKRDSGDNDGWQANWDNQLSSKEHRVVQSGSKENNRVEKQGSEEDSPVAGTDEVELRNLYVPKNEISDRFYPR